VLLVNPKNPKQKVASSKINGRWVGGKISWFTYCDVCFKVDVVVAHVLDTPLMYPYEADDQVVMRDVVGICTLWNWKYVKVVV